MLYNIARLYEHEFGAFRLLTYLTFRSGAACLTALVVSFLVGPAFIRWLKRVQRHGQPIRRTDRSGTWSRRRARRPWAAA
jgi:phospho-N-acetylmuramoyl-pentapeptide-transferase